MPGCKLTGALLCGAMVWAVPGWAQAAPPASSPPSAAPPAGQADLTITGKRMPGAEAPRSATCEAMARDPFFRAQMAAGIAPNVYVPTRMPRNPDYSAPPAAPPGSPLPSLSGSRFGVSDPVYDDRGSAVEFPDVAEAVEAANDMRPEGAVADGPVGQTSLESAIDACRAAYSRGGGSIRATARATIARRDETLPMAFALFDQGRYAEALEWFRKAADKLPLQDGGDEAALFVGKLHLQGLGDKSDPVEGVKWLKKAATAPFNPQTETPVFDPRRPERNTAVGEAAVMLGNIYQNGFRGIAKDPEAARKWFDRAYDVGHIAAAKTLGDLYSRGIDTPRDVKKAVSDYRKAAAFGYIPAQVALADILYEGDTGVPQDRKAALAWYGAAARAEDPRALYALARAFDLGEDVKSDPKRAIVLYKAAALKGHPAAQVAMGTYFYEGKQVPKDDTTARRWFEAAAAKSDPDGMFNLAAMTARGEGGVKDVPRAWAGLRQAARLGHPTAPRALAALEQRMTPAEKQAALAAGGPVGR